MFKRVFNKFLENNKKKFIRDSYWLVSSNILLAICGLFLNILITKFYGSEGLGLFGLGLKSYLVLSIISVFGGNNSIIKYIAIHKKETNQLGVILANALFLSTITTIIIGIGTYVILPYIVHFLPDLNDELILSFMAGLLFFSWNKVLLSVLNAHREFKMLSIIQALRWVIICTLAVTSISYQILPIELLGLCFALTEIILFPICLYNASRFVKGPYGFSKKWFSIHFNYGGKTMLSSTVIDLYNYTDIFIIGIFLNIKAVGIYIFAADIVKNLVMIANLIQVNFDPLAAEYWHNDKRDKLIDHIYKIRNNTLLMYVPIIGLAILGYYLFISYFMPSTFMASLPPFIILAVGILIHASFKPFNAIPSLCGFPLDNLIINLVVLLINIIFSSLFVQYLDINGVALATTIAYIVSVILLKISVQKRTKINLLKW